MGPKSQSHPTGQSLFSFFLLFFFYFSLSSPLFFLSLFFFICSSSEQKAHTHQPLTRIAFFLLSSDLVFFVLLPPVTHMLTHAHPSREIIDIDLQSHTEKLHHTFILLLVAIVLILQSGRSVKIGIQSNDLLGIHSNDLAGALNRHPQQRSGQSIEIDTHSNDLIWKLCC